MDRRYHPESMALAEQQAPRKTRLRAISSAPRPEVLSPRLLRVLTGAEALMLRDGFAHLNTAEMVRLLSCSKTSLYRIAPSLESLFRLVVDRLMSSIRVEGRAAAERAGDWYDAVVAFFDAAVPVTKRASVEFFRDVRRLPATRERLERHRHERMADLEALIRAGIDDGAFRGLPPRLLAEMLFATVGRLTEPGVLAGLGMTASEAVAEAYRVFEYGVVPRRGRRGRGKDLGLAGIWPSDSRSASEGKGHR